MPLVLVASATVEPIQLQLAAEVVTGLVFEVEFDPQMELSNVVGGT